MLLSAMKSLPELRVLGSSFFGPDLTFMTLLQHLCLLICTMLYNWKMGEDTSPVNPRAFGISENALLLYALSFSSRLVEYYPFEYLFYDVAVCAGFALLFWITLGKSMYFNSKISMILSAEERKENLSRPLGLHATVLCTGLLAYAFNYDHLEMTPKLFCFAWSHYLEAVAMIPQYMTVAKMAKRGRIGNVTMCIWGVMIFSALSRIFQLLNWAYLWQIAELLDKLAVISALFHLAFLVVFSLVIYASYGLSLKAMGNAENEPDLKVKVQTEAEEKEKLVEESK